MSEMNNHESFERIAEGLSRAASCCRELVSMTGIPQWKEVSRQLLLMRKKAKFMYESAPLTEMQIQALVAEMEVAQKMAAAMRANG